MQIIACCSQAPSHYLNQCWPRSTMPPARCHTVNLGNNGFTLPVCHHCHMRSVFTSVLLIWLLLFFLSSGTWFVAMNSSVLSSQQSRWSVFSLELLPRVNWPTHMAEGRLFSLYTLCCLRLDLLHRFQTLGSCTHSSGSLLVLSLEVGMVAQQNFTSIGACN